MPEETHKRSLWIGIGQQVLSFVVGLIVAVFFLGGARQKMVTLGRDMDAWKVEWKEASRHITAMDLEGSVATKNFIANYEKKQATQDATIKELQDEVRHLELMKAQIDRLERKIGDPPNERKQP